AGIAGSNLATRFSPARQVAQLHAENGALNCVHAVVEPLHNVLIFAGFSPVAEQARLGGVLRVGGHQRSPFAVRTQVFAGIEAEAADITDTSHTPAVVLGAM